MKIYILMIGLAVGLISCYRDLGNYDYREINEVKVLALPDQVKYTGIDSLIVLPVLEYTQEPQGEYTYEWSVIRTGIMLGADNKAIVIGQAKELRYFVELPAGKYIATLNVTDETTSLVWKSNFNLTVSSPTYKGWMVLCDDHGKARLDMMEDSGEASMLSFDILSRTPLPVKHEPWKMQIVTLDMGGSWEIFMLTGEGGVRLVPEDLSWEESNDFPYLMADPALQDCKPQVFCGSATVGTLMIADGNAYWRRHQGSPLFGRPVNGVDGRLVKLAPFIGYQAGESTLFGANNFVLFDEENGNFLKYYRNDDVCKVIPGFPEGYELVFMQNTTYNEGTTYAILKKEAHYFLFSFLANELKQLDWTEMDIPGLDQIQYFAFDPLYPYLFYADDQALNLYNWLEEPGKRIKPMLSLEGQEVTLLKYNMTFEGSLENGAVYPDRYLLIGTLDAAGVGTFSMFEPQPNMQELLPAGSNAVFSRIVDVTYRER